MSQRAKNKRFRQQTRTDAVRTTLRLSASRNYYRTVLLMIWNSVIDYRPQRCEPEVRLNSWWIVESITMERNSGAILSMVVILQATLRPLILLFLLHTNSVVQQMNAIDLLWTLFYVPCFHWVDSSTENHWMTHYSECSVVQFFLFLLPIFLSGDCRFFRRNATATRNIVVSLRLQLLPSLPANAASRRNFIIRLNRLLTFADAKLFYLKLQVEDIILHEKKLKSEKNGGKQSKNWNERAISGRSNGWTQFRSSENPFAETQPSILRIPNIETANRIQIDCTQDGLNEAAMQQRMLRPFDKSFIHPINPLSCGEKCFRGQQNISSRCGRRPCRIESNRIGKLNQIRNGGGSLVGLDHAPLMCRELVNYLGAFKIFLLDLLNNNNNYDWIFAWLIKFVVVKWMERQFHANGLWISDMAGIRIIRSTKKENAFIMRFTIVECDARATETRFRKWTIK